MASVSVAYARLLADAGQPGAALGGRRSISAGQALADLYAALERHDEADHVGEQIAAQQPAEAPE